jgi:hypothetical protein
MNYEEQFRSTIDEGRIMFVMLNEGSIFFRQTEELNKRGRITRDYLRRTIYD